MIKNIVFDLGGVILKDYPYDYLRDCKDFDAIKESFFKDWLDLDLGNINLIDKLNMCNLSSELQCEYKDLLLNYYKYRNLNSDLIELINRLKNNGYMVYILSDNNWDAYNYYRKLDIFNNVDAWVMSCEYNTLKEDGRLFEILFSKYDLNPYECLFIDDKKNNISIGNSYGMKGFIFNNNYDELVSYLKKLNIKL